MNLDKTSTKAFEDVDKNDTKKETDQMLEKIAELQATMYAESKHSFLVILQGMDASGKDGTIRKVFSSINPMGCSVTSFKAPNNHETSHDFLWRIHNQTPERGMIKVFNRSQYEDILVPTVEKFLPTEQIDRRYDDINNFEKLLEDNNTHVLKFYLHISKEEQQERFKERLDIPEKRWKHNPNDHKTSSKWDAYMSVYEEIFKRCGKDNPWNIIPADQNWYRDYMITKVIYEKMVELKMKYPKPNFEKN